MKAFWERNKIFLIITVTTLLVLGGGIFLMSKPAGPPTTNTVDSSILLPQGVYKTSGFVNGEYLPASSSAAITLVEFGDYECPACGIYEPYVKKILTDFPGKVTYVFRNYPLPQHKNAPISSYAVEAAGIQGKYWEMHEKMFVNQSAWSGLSDPSGVFVSYAKDLGLNVDQFTSDMNSKKVKDIVQRDTSDGNTVKLTETPTFYINDTKVSLTGDANQLESLIQSEIGK